MIFCAICLKTADERKFYGLIQITTKTPRHKEEGFKNPSGRAIVGNFLPVRKLAVCET